MFSLYFSEQTHYKFSILKLYHSMRLMKFFTILITIIFSHQAFVSELPLVEDTALQECISKAMLKARITEAHALPKLKCHNKAIASLSGIEYFSGLEHLSLFGNQIVNADLSKLTNLKHLNLAKNKLMHLDITGLSQLEALYLFKNELTTINFEGLSSLKKMRIMQNKLSKLDISPLLSLSEAYLWDNQLEDLQITGLSKLVFLDVKQNPMPDELYDFFDEQDGITISHDGNAEDWK